MDLPGDCNELETHPRASLSESDDVILTIRTGAKISQYSHVSASDQARQHIGDVFHGPVTLQHVAATSATATVPVRGAGRESLMESLVFKEMDARFVDVHPNLVGTCEWLSKTPEYKRWRDPELMSTHHGFFWIKGKAGAGKSTLMKHASTQAEAKCSSRQHVLNFFFHARGGSFETSTDGLFRSLLHQLLEKVPVVYDSLDKRRLGFVERQGWSSALLKDTFREAVLSLDQDQVTCYIDAMDECRHEDIENIIQYFDDLGDALVANGKLFYVCLSSRHYPNLRFSKSVELVLESQYGHNKDVRQYIHQRLLIDREDLNRELAKVIRFRANGVFLWVVLVVALVNQDDRNGNAADIYQRLDQIPTGLSDLFNELIQRGTSSDHFRPLLQWVAFSIRPLEPTELYCILVPSAPTTELKAPAFDEKDLAKFILSASKGLVETTTDFFPLRSRVQFIHESLRTYFLGEGVVHLTNQSDIDRACRDAAGFRVPKLVAMRAFCHDQLKKRCLSYLLLIIPVLRSELSKKREERIIQHSQVSTVYPFFTYAVHGVMVHANTALDLGLAQRDFLEALPWNELSILQEIVDRLYCGWPAFPVPETWYKVRTAAMFGCPKLVNAVLETHPRLELDRWQSGSILSASMRASDDESLSITLRAGADPNAPSFSTSAGQCLQEAVNEAPQSCHGDSTLESRRWRIVELLLKYGAKPYATVESPQDCLYEASGKNDLKAARTLLGEHLKADTQCSDFGMSLARAAGQASRLENNEMFRFLLDKGSETGWWSRATPKRPADVAAFLEVKFEDTSILHRILLEGARVAPSTDLSARIVLSGVLKGSTSVVMHFEQGSSWILSQS